MCVDVVSQAIIITNHHTTNESRVKSQRRQTETDSPESRQQTEVSQVGERASESSVTCVRLYGLPCSTAVNSMVRLCVVVEWLKPRRCARCMRAFYIYIYRYINIIVATKLVAACCTSFLLLNHTRSHLRPRNNNFHVVRNGNYVFLGSLEHLVIKI